MLVMSYSRLLELKLLIKSLNERSEKLVTAGSKCRVPNTKVYYVHTRVMMPLSIVARFL